MRLTVNMPANGGQIEVKGHLSRTNNMGGTSIKPEKGKTTRDGGKKPPPKAVTMTTTRMAIWPRPSATATAKTMTRVKSRVVPG